MASSRRILQLRFNLDGLGGSEVMTNVSYVVQVELQDPDNDERLFTQKEPVTVDKSELDTGDRRGAVVRPPVAHIGGP